MPIQFKTSSVDVNVKLKRVGNELVVPKPEIRMRMADTGEPVEKVRVIAETKYYWIGTGKILASLTKFIEPESEKEISGSEVLQVLEHYNYKLINSKAEILDEDDGSIEYYYVDDDGEHVVRPFERTRVLEIPDENWVPSTVIDEFLISNEYEVYAEKKADIVKLWEEAEKRLKEDVIGVTTYSHGRGFTEYYAFLVPIVHEGKFGWLLKLTDTKVKLNHLMDIPAKVKIPIKEAPTLKTLPPVQLVVATARKKKKAKA